MGSSKGEELLHGRDVVVAKLGGAHVGTVVGVVDFGFLRVGHDALEGVGAEDEAVVRSDPVLRGDHAVAEHDRGKVHGLAAHRAADAQLEAGTVLHALLEGDLGGVVKGLGRLERHHGVVAGGIFTLEALGLESGFTAIPNEDRGGFDDGLLGEVLLGEGAGEVQFDLAAAQGERLGVHLEVELLDGLFHFSEAATTGQGKEKEESGEQERQGLADDVLHVHESCSRAKVRSPGTPIRLARPPWRRTFECGHRCACRHSAPAAF